MNELPTAAEAKKLAKAAASKPLVLPDSITKPIKQAIDAGKMYITVDVSGDWNQTKALLESRGYECASVATGMNETGLQVRWGYTKEELDREKAKKDYYSQRP
jgi:hypothetical protein